MFRLKRGVIFLCLIAAECSSSPFSFEPNCPKGEVSIYSVEAYVSKCEHVNADLLYCVGKTKEHCLKSSEFVTCHNTTDQCDIDNIAKDHNNKTLRVVEPRFCWPSDKRKCVQKGGCVFTYRLEDISDQSMRKIMIWLMVIVGIRLAYTMFKGK